MMAPLGGGPTVVDEDFQLITIGMKMYTLLSE